MSEAATPPAMSAIVPPPAPPAPAGRLDDFDDRLSPMLVKELRQGLRAKTFVSVFLGLQALLAFVLLIAAGAAAPERAGSAISSIIFFFFSLAVLVVQPLRGIGALHTEIKGNTIDLMVLTRLSAWRIVLGKWVAIVSQSGLLLVAIAPYLILRYFFGGMNLFAELLLLALIFFTSAVCTAVTVGISAVSSILVRGLAPLAGVLFLLGTIPAMAFGNDFQDLVAACSLDTPVSRWGVLTYLLVGSYLAWSTLGLGASMIAPMAENHSTLRRLIAMGMVVLCGLIGRIDSVDDELVVIMVVLVCIPAISLALTEPFFLLPPITRPFAKRGAPGLVAGRFLYPGWPSGVLFTFALTVLATAAIWQADLPYFDADEIVALLSVLGSLIFPAVVVTSLGDRVKNRFSAYLVVLTSSVILVIVLTILAESMRQWNFLWIFSWLPPLHIPLVANHRISDSLVLTVSSTVCAIYGGILLLQALRKMPEISHAERAALKPAAEEP